MGYKDIRTKNKRKEWQGKQVVASSSSLLRWRARPRKLLHRLCIRPPTDDPPNQASEGGTSGEGC